MSVVDQSFRQPLLKVDLSRGHFKVARSVFVDPKIRELELERIFANCWLYLGHESELPKPNDFLTRTVGGRPLLFLRDREGKVRAYLNICPHRGATVCRESRGNAKSFTCIFHGWTFGANGKLLDQPGKECFAPNFNDDESANLTPVPKLDEYRGFWFFNLNPKAEPLHDYLAGAKDYIDKVVDQSEKGMRIIGGTQEYSIRANWKMMAENSIDIYHGPALHPTYIDYLQNTTGATAPLDGLGGYAYDLGNGHGVAEYLGPWGRPVARWIPLWGDGGKREIDAIRGRLEKRFGPERAKRLADNSFNLLIFPNLVINDIVSITIRTFEPVSPNYMTVTAQCIGPKEESGALLERRISNFLEFLGPAGFATPDDIEAIETAQHSFGAHSGWNDVSKGMLLEKQGWMDEGPIRAFWSEWNRRMTAAE